MRQTRWPELAVRVVLLLAGLTVAHLGVTLFLESDLGSDPFNVLVQGLYRSLPWPGWRWTPSSPCPAGCWEVWWGWAPWCAPGWWAPAPRSFSPSVEGCAISA